MHPLRAPILASGSRAGFDLDSNNERLWDWLVQLPHCFQTEKEGRKGPFLGPQQACFLFLCDLISPKGLKASRGSSEGGSGPGRTSLPPLCPRWRPERVSLRARSVWGCVGGGIAGHWSRPQAELRADLLFAGRESGLSRCSTAGST